MAEALEVDIPVARIRRLVELLQTKYVVTVVVLCVQGQQVPISLKISMDSRATGWEFPTSVTEEPRQSSPVGQQEGDINLHLGFILKQ